MTDESAKKVIQKHCVEICDLDYGRMSVHFFQHGILSLKEVNKFQHDVDLSYPTERTFFRERNFGKMWKLVQKILSGADVVNIIPILIAGVKSAKNDTLADLIHKDFCQTDEVSETGRVVATNEKRRKNRVVNETEKKREDEISRIQGNLEQSSETREKLLSDLKCKLTIEQPELSTKSKTRPTQRDELRLNLSNFHQDQDDLQVQQLVRSGRESYRRGLFNGTYNASTL